MAGQLLLLAQQNIATSNGEKHICEKNFFIFLQFFNDEIYLFSFTIIIDLITVKVPLVMP